MTHCIGIAVKQIVACLVFRQFPHGQADGERLGPIVVACVRCQTTEYRPHYSRRSVDTDETRVLALINEPNLTGL